MAYISTDVVITSEWKKLNDDDEVITIARVSGSKVLFRYSSASDSRGMPLDDIIIVDREVEVRAVAGQATLVVSKEE